MSAIKKNAATKTIILPAEKPGKNKGKHEAGLLLDFVTKTTLPLNIATILIHEINGDRNYKVLPLSSERSLQDYKKMPAEVMHSIRLLTAERLSIIKQEAERKYNSTVKNEIACKDYLEQKMLSHIYYRLQELKPFSAILKWYCRYADDLNNIFIKPALSVTIHQNFALNCCVHQQVYCACW